MKHSFLIPFLFVISIGTSQAQTYKLNKQVYNPADYVAHPNDKYNPRLAAIASVPIPGLGQMISGEIGRGFAFLGGTAAGYGTALVGMHLTFHNATSDGKEQGMKSKNHGTLGTVLLTTGLMSGIIMHVWSVVDAAQVAKVNNMYYEDINGNLSKIILEVNPFLDTNNHLRQINTSAGISLRMTF